MCASGPASLSLRFNGLPPLCVTGARAEAAAGHHGAGRPRPLPGETALLAVAPQRSQLLWREPGKWGSGRVFGGAAPNLVVVMGRDLKKTPFRRSQALDGKPGLPLLGSSVLSVPLWTLRAVWR